MTISLAGICKCNNWGEKGRKCVVTLFIILQQRMNINKLYNIQLLLSKGPKVLTKTFKQFFSPDPKKVCVKDGNEYKVKFSFLPKTDFFFYSIS